MKKEFTGGSKLIAILCGISLFVPASFAQEKKEAAAASDSSKEKLPTAQEVVDRFIKEMGGKDAYSKLKSQTAKGTIDMPAQQIKGTMEVFAAQPNKLLIKMNMGPAGEITTGFDGKVAWMKNAFTGPMLLEGKQKEQIATQANFDHILHDPKDYKSMEVTGVTTFEGEECYNLKLVDHFRNETTEYFSKKTGLQKGFVGTQESPFGPVKATTVLEEYKKFGDLTMPSKMKQKMSGMESVITISEMEFNNVPENTFELPEDVKALVKKP